MPKRIIRYCRLETEGYRAVFEIRSLETTQEYVDAVVEFQINPQLCQVSIKSIPFFITVSDLQAFVEYFHQHIACLRQNPSSESPVFTIWGLGFQVQAFSGEIYSQADGEFTIRFMVNIGQIGEESCRTYVGGESIITFDKIRYFTAKVQSIIAALSQD